MKNRTEIHSNTAENNNVKFWFDDEILFSSYKGKVDMTEDIALKTIELRHSISKNEYQYWCMDISNIRSVTREANTCIDEKGQDLVQACAAVVNSFLTKFLVDVFVRTKKPKVPFKIFTSAEKAVIWLKELKNNNNNNKK